MKTWNMDRGWLFHLGDIPKPEETGHTFCYMAAKAGGAVGAASPDYDFSGWQEVDLPHDWAVYGEFGEQYGPSAGYKPRGKGWYVKRFKLDKEAEGKQILIEFGGISSHAVVYCNGSVVGRNFCGYTSFTVDITDMALYGDRVNTLSVFVDATEIEGWWYEGAGIYRHVTMYEKEPVHIAHWGTWVKPQKRDGDRWNTQIETTVENSSYETAGFEAVAWVKDAQGTVCGQGHTEGSVSAGDTQKVSVNIPIDAPRLWDIDDSYLYTLVNEVYIEGTLCDRQEVPFGYRSISISCDDGFFLNGRRVQLYGTCNHQDHAGVGIAVPDAVVEYRIRLLKEMGSNAYRCAHGNPSREVLDACDRYGLLVMDENRNFSSSPEGVEQVRQMVLRDRNHPSVVMYSIFNEEPLQGTPTGRRLAERLACEIKKLDDTRFLTGAMNTGVSEEDSAARALDIVGFNYITHLFDEFRERFPDKPMLGSENDSAFATRGVYETDENAHVIDNYDSVAAPWGNTYRDGMYQIESRSHIMGMFVWTGFDYRGEPTPFEWPSIGTQFGIMDTCGFKKDVYYLNQAYFKEEPVLHIFPHWNWDEGKQVRVMAYTNCEEVELFLNGTSLGRKKTPRYEMADWMVSYRPGVLCAVGFRGGQEAAKDSIKTTREAKRLRIEASRELLWDGCDDTVVVNVSVQDADGGNLPIDNRLVRFQTEGGEIIGVGNGDPNSHEADKADKRRLFHGHCQVIVKQTDGAKTVTIRAEADGVEGVRIALPVQKAEHAVPYLPSVMESYLSTWRKNVTPFSEKPNPMQKIEDHDMNTWAVVRAGEQEKPDAGYLLYKTTLNLPEDGGKTISFAELTAQQAEIFLSGEKVFEGGCEYGRSVSIQTDKVGEQTLSVILYNQTADKRTGLTKSVILRKD